ncbi:MAG: hypothetical protein SYC29_03095 [Planctomycetota bacterium]|nr:hypothetical protein [Planctomycetota bacterium]
MRLITSRKLYRAFPELDQFGDERCERLVRRLRSDVVGVRIVLLPLAAFTIALPSTALLGLVAWGAGLPACEMIAGKRNGETLLIAIVIVGVVLAPALAVLLTRDVVLGGAVRRALVERLELTRCRGCRYLLLGQRVIDGIIICPECGRPTTLAELGLHSPEDLIPPGPGEDPIPDELSRPEPEPEPQRVTDTQRLLQTRERTRAEWEDRAGSEPRT